MCVLSSTSDRFCDSEGGPPGPHLFADPEIRVPTQKLEKCCAVQSQAGRSCYGDTISPGPSH